MAEDGCNTCTCSLMPDGNLVGACTLMLCIEEPDNQCVANGVTYMEGEEMSVDRETVFKFMRKDGWFTAVNVDELRLLPRASIH